MILSIAQSVLWIKFAEDVWFDFKEMFGEGDTFRISDILEDIYHTRQGSYNVGEFYTQLKLFWDELFNLIPLDVCICNPKCSCGVAEKFRLQL